MFNKLLSNLPFNPSLIGQVSFYAKRLRQETSVRRLGFILVVLTMLVQLFAVLAPAQPTLARSGNDIIEGGFDTRDQAVLHCLNGSTDFSKILDYYGITCTDIGQAATVTVRSTDYNRQLFSMGKIAYGKAGETPVSIQGKTYWLRYLWSWDGVTTSSYKALKGTNREGRTFMVLYDCGNLVFIGLPPPATPKCVWNPNILSTDPKCFEPCPVRGKQGIPKTSSQCFEPCPVTGKTNIPANDPRCFEPCPVKGKESVPKNSSLCFTPCPYNSTIPTDSPSCKPCSASQSSDDKTACLEFHKTATNRTQNISDANGTTAKGGDVIVYNLSVKNTGKATINKFVVTENISDILDYADIVDLGGATKDKDNNLNWPGVDLKANQTLKKRFSVKIKDPIPQTPTSSSDPGHFDLLMTNVYGNAVNIKLPPSVIKTTETIVQTLPKTGPGTSLIVGFAGTTIIGYFFARSRLMAKELDIVRSEYTTSGGL